MQCLLEGASSGAWAPFCVGLFFAEDTFSKSRCLFFHLFFLVARTQQEAFWGWSNKSSPQPPATLGTELGPGLAQQPPWAGVVRLGHRPGRLQSTAEMWWWLGGGWLAVGMGSLVSSETQPSLLPRLPAHALGRTMPGPFQIQGFFYIVSPAFPGNRPLSIPKLF